MDLFEDDNLNSRFAPSPFADDDLSAVSGFDGFEGDDLAGWYEDQLSEVTAPLPQQPVFTPQPAHQQPPHTYQPQGAYYPQPKIRRGMPGWAVACLITAVLVIAGGAGLTAAGSLFGAMTRVAISPDTVLNANLDQEERQEYKPLNDGTPLSNSEKESIPAFSDADETVAKTAPEAVQEAYNGISYTWFPSGTVDYPMPYYRAHLTEDQQKRYDDIFYALNEMNETVYFENGELSVGELELLIDSVTADHPGIFWSESSYSYFTFGTGDTVYAIEFEYNMTPSEKASCQSQIEQVSAPVVEHAKTLGSDYEKTKYFYEWLDETIVYSADLSNIHTQTIKGAFLDRFTACAGYARAFQYLCYCVDIPCIYVTGEGDGGDGKGWVPHAWNACQIDGVSVYEDVTWGDSDDGEIPYHYSFLDLTKDDLVKTNHTFKYPDIMPEANDNRYEWWVINDGWMGAYDIHSVADRCSAEMVRGMPATYLMFDSPSAMEACYADFTGSNSSGATQMLYYQPSLAYTGVSYWVQRVDSLNMLIFVWY